MYIYIYINTLPHIYHTPNEPANEPANVIVYIDLL